MKTYYLKVSQPTGKILDVITSPHVGYEPITLSSDLPVDILSQAYRYDNGSIVYVSEWDENQRMLELDMAVAELSMAIGGMLNV